MPSLSVGFTKSTCLVQVDKAAKASYNATGKDRRVLYLIDNKETIGNKDMLFIAALASRDVLGLYDPVTRGIRRWEHWLDSASKGSCNP